MQNTSVTEFGIFTRLYSWDYQKKYKLKNVFIPRFILFLDFAYNNNINEVYLFKIQDTANKKGKLGYFDELGNKKEIYKQLNMLYKVIRDGYYINKDKELLSVVGNDKTILLNLDTNTFVIKDTVN